METEFEESVTQDIMIWANHNNVDLTNSLNWPIAVYGYWAEQLS
jgi:hypothetical protein